MERQWSGAQYHLHVYFDDSSEAEALRLLKLAQAREDIISVGRFHTGPVGPHPVRQFQLLVNEEVLEAVVAWLDGVRGPLDVLVHPNIEDERLAHTRLARWLGRAHALDLSCFPIQG